MPAVYKFILREWGSYGERLSRKEGELEEKGGEGNQGGGTEICGSLTEMDPHEV